MPKNTGSGEDRAKVKFRFYEFELEGASSSVENSIKQITQAFGAKPAIVVQPKYGQLNGKVAKDATAIETPEAVEEEYLDQEEEGAPEEETSAAKPKPARKPSKPKMPQRIPGLDLTGSSTTFKDFAAAKAPTSNASRYLVAACWLREFGNSPTITVDKVYTCYKEVGWPLDLGDWDARFRSQIKDDKFRRTKSGEYEITPKGENAVKELDAAE